MSADDFAGKNCASCVGEGTVIVDPAANMSSLHPDWHLDGMRLVRRFTFKGFAKAVQMANLAAWLGEKTGHHPDVGFGWGWCEVAFTSHELGGVSENDFACAAKLDAIVA